MLHNIQPSIPIIKAITIFFLVLFLLFLKYIIIPIINAIGIKKFLQILKIVSVSFNLGSLVGVGLYGTPYNSCGTISANIFV